MKLAHLPIVTLIVIGVLASTARAEFDFFFPFEGNPVGTISNNLDPTAKYTQVGIGFTFIANSPDTPFFPNETGSPCTVNVVDGGIIPSTVKDVIVANQSALNISGSGEVDTTVDVYDTSSVNVNGGSITGDLQLMGNSSAAVSEGTIRDVLCDGNNQVTISGGTVTESLNALSPSTITVTGGSIGGQLNAIDGGMINVTGGSIGSTVSATSVGENTQISVSIGNTFAEVATQDGGTFDMTGGTITGNVDTAVVSGTSGGSVFLTNVTVNGTVFGETATIGLGSGSTVDGMVTVLANSDLTTSATLNDGMRASNSSVAMNGGLVTGNVLLQGNSTFALTGGGTVNGAVEGEDQTAVLLVSGTVGTGTGEAAIANGDSFDLAGANVAGDVDVFTNFTFDSGTVSGNVTDPGGTVTINAGGIGNNLIVGGAPGANATMNDGAITGEILANQDGQVTMNGGGVMGGVDSSGTGSFTMNGGSVSGNLTSIGTSLLALNGGIVGTNIDSFDQSSVVIDGNQTGGIVTVTGTVTAHDSSSLVIASALILGDVDVDNSASATIFGSTTILGTLNFSQSAHVVLNGFNLNGPHPADAVLIDGMPAPLDEIFLDDQATLQINGLTFSANLLDPMNDNGMFSEYQLAGTFPDGSSFPDDMLLFVQNGSGASFQFVAVPEPVTSALVISAIGVGLFRRPSRRGGVAR
jgi:hypothetical protein